MTGDKPASEKQTVEEISGKNEQKIKVSRENLWF